MKSEIDLLREQGLKPVSSGYQFVPGETVIVTTKGNFEGTSATVVEWYGSDSVLVMPESKWNDPLFDPESAGVTDRVEPEIFKRHELAVWDYDSVWKVNAVDPIATNTSVRESKQKLASLLSSLNTAKRKGEQGATTKEASPKKPFVSSRERKAANGKKKKT